MIQNREIMVNKCCMHIVVVLGGIYTQNHIDRAPDKVKCCLKLLKESWDVSESAICFAAVS